MPTGVKSAYVSIAGGGSGGTTDFIDSGFTAVPLISGASGGFLAAYPLNLTPGEVITINIGPGGEDGPNRLLKYLLAVLGWKKTPA